jgi:hypothetical protein
VRYSDTRSVWSVEGMAGRRDGALTAPGP